ncbi:MAG: restriction endonuclease [Candidatus Sumerlaeaceae bacterium]
MQINEGRQVRDPGWVVRVWDWMEFASNRAQLAASFLIAAVLVVPSALVGLMVRMPGVREIAFLITFVLVAGALLFAVAKGMLRVMRFRLLRYIPGPDALRKISGRELEDLTQEIYESLGYKVRKRAVPGKPDGGIDLEVLRNGKRGLVQCKLRTTDAVDVRQVRELFAVLIENGADYAVLITTTGFTEPAQKTAFEKPIELVDHLKLWEMVQDARLEERVAAVAAKAQKRAQGVGVYAREKLRCAVCGEELTLKENDYGPFLVCSAGRRTNCDTLVPLRDGRQRSKFQI